MNLKNRIARLEKSQSGQTAELAECPDCLNNEYVTDAVDTPLCPRCGQPPRSLIVIYDAQTGPRERVAPRDLTVMIPDNGRDRPCVLA